MIAGPGIAAKTKSLAVANEAGVALEAVEQEVKASEVPETN